MTNLFTFLFFCIVYTEVHAIQPYAMLKHLSHDDAIPDRDLSVSNAMLRKEKLSLAEKTILAQRVDECAVAIFGSVTNLVRKMSLALLEWHTQRLL